MPKVAHMERDRARVQTQVICFQNLGLGKWCFPKDRCFPTCVCYTVLCLVTQSCPTLFNPVDCSPPGSSVHGDSPGKNTGVGFHALLQGFNPWGGKIPWKKAWQHTLVFLPGESPWTEEPGGLQSTGLKRIRQTKQLSTAQSIQIVAYSSINKLVFTYVDCHITVV